MSTPPPSPVSAGRFPRNRYRTWCFYRVKVLIFRVCRPRLSQHAPLTFPHASNTSRSRSYECYICHDGILAHDLCHPCRGVSHLLLRYIAQDLCVSQSRQLVRFTPGNTVYRPRRCYRSGINIALKDVDRRDHEEVSDLILSVLCEHVSETNVARLIAAPRSSCSRTKRVCAPVPIRILGRKTVRLSADVKDLLGHPTVGVALFGSTV